MSVAAIDPAAFVALVDDRFEEAAATTGRIELDVEVAGVRIRLTFAGDALVARLTAAFLGVAPADPAVDADVRIAVWDSWSTGTPLPPPPWSWDRYCTRGDIDGWSTDAVRIAYAGWLSVHDRTTGTACWWVPDARTLPLAESGAPLRVLLHWCLEGRGLQVAHAAAVGPPSGGGALLAGAGGAGKSSTALACLRAGWRYVGDDYCALTPGGDDGPRVHRLYATAKADDATRRRIGGLAVAGEAPLPDRGKSLLYLSPTYDAQLAASLPVDVVLLPRVVDHDRTALHEASPLDTTRALADSTLGQLPGAGAPAWRTLAGIARAVPGYHLDLGREADRLPEVIADALADTGSRA